MATRQHLRLNAAPEHLSASGAVQHLVRELLRRRHHRLAGAWRLLLPLQAGGLRGLHRRHGQAHLARHAGDALHDGWRQRLRLRRRQDLLEGVGGDGSCGTRTARLHDGRQQHLRLRRWRALQEAGGTPAARLHEAWRQHLWQRRRDLLEGVWGEGPGSDHAARLRRGHGQHSRPRHGVVEHGHWERLLQLRPREALQYLRPSIALQHLRAWQHLRASGAHQHLLIMSAWQHLRQRGAL
mmetsp:Transcript_100761/g.285271  ORF Transcript_100761/g.285271 Transcript_100761/m.285271 type:complete len:239 (+) Transcript_100761:56-772(+)